MMWVAVLVLVKAVLLLLLLMAPEIILQRSMLRASPSVLRRHASILLMICLPLASADLNFASITAVAFLVTVNAFWQLSLAYFGSPLRADDLTLLVKPDHFRDVVSVGWSELGRFKRVLLLLGASLVAALALVRAPPLHQFGEWGGMLAWTIILVRMTKVAARKRNDVYVDPSMPGAIGGLQALAVAIAWRLFPAEQLPGNISYKFSEPRNLTVAVIMGESLNFSRMDIFSPGLNVTPNLLALTESEGPFRLMARRGLSAGVASNASVSGLLAGSPFPWHAQGARSLFDLATQQGFETFYWSGQARTPIELLDRGRFIGNEHCFEHSPADFAARKDWLLVDKLNVHPPGQREFFFVYPRCNHAPYVCHGLAPTSPAVDHKAGSAGLVQNYDVGMREFDKVIAGLLAGFRGRATEDLFVFITSDHNELLGEGGLTGHMLSDHALGALVPYMLYTNRPDHPVAQAFQAANPPNSFFLSRMLMSLMGVEPEVEPEYPGNASYVCNSLPFGHSGYMRVASDAIDGMHEVEHFNRLGERTHVTKQLLPGLADASSHCGHVLRRGVNHREAVEPSGQPLPLI